MNALLMDDDIVIPPLRSVGPYDLDDRVNYTDVMTAVCDWPGALAPVNITFRCVFDYTDDQYRLLGDTLDCAGARLNVEWVCEL